MRSVVLFLLVLTLTPVLSLAQPQVLFQHQIASDPNWGSRAFAVGDQNSDGYDDFAFEVTYPPGTRRIEFFHGGNPLPASPYLVIYTDTLNRGGIGVAAAAGDLNGDGYEDWFRFVEYADMPAWYSWEYFRGGAYPDSTPWIAHLIPWSAGTICPIGDFNGDGYADLMLVGTDYEQYRHDTYVYFGGDSLTFEPAWYGRNRMNWPGADRICCSGDLNGDGFTDLLARNPMPMILYIYWGSAHPDTVPGTTWINFQLGYASNIVNDLNGDGCDELIVCSDQGIELHFGGPYMSRVPDEFIGGTTDAPSRFVSAGDINGDGYGDFFQISATKSYVYLGHPWVNPVPSLAYGPVQELTNMAGLGDVNGDGVGDFSLFTCNNGHLDMYVYAGDSTMRAPVDDVARAVPSTIGLSVYPNPFNSSATITFALPRQFRVNLVVFDVAGRLVETLTNDAFPAGEHHINVDGANLPSGVYFIRLRAGDGAQSQKLMLLK